MDDLITLLWMTTLGLDLLPYYTVKKSSQAIMVKAAVVCCYLRSLGLPSVARHVD